MNAALALKLTTTLAKAHLRQAEQRYSPLSDELRVVFVVVFFLLAA